MTGEPSIIAEGECGSAVNWTLDDTGTLWITGTGEIFDYSTGTAPWYDRRGSITSIVVEDGVESLGNYSFENCDHLVALTLPESLHGFGFYAVCGCENLEELLIPGYINCLWNHAIYDCEKLHVSLYQRGSFILSQLREYNIPFTVLDADSDYIYIEGGRTISAYLGSDPIVFIPEGVTRIYNNAFAYIDEIETVMIPECITVIEGDAFKNCISLKSVSLPVTLTYLGEEAFEGCSSLESITIPSNLKCLTAGIISSFHWPAL